jgi:hypothetical protein
MSPRRRILIGQSFPHPLFPFEDPTDRDPEADL